MSLQPAVISTLKEYVFKPLYQKGDWKILVMDARATRVVSTVFRMHQLAEYGICGTESIYCARQRFRKAIYILHPGVDEVKRLLQDFPPDAPIYLEAYVFFLHECPENILLSLSESHALRFIKKVAQLDIDFVPFESSVFSFESPETAHLYPLPLVGDHEKQLHMDLLAERLATVCVTLQEYPKICYHKTDVNMQLANLLQTKLDRCMKANSEMGRGEHKDKSILLILDRGFDPVSPIVHELTLQAACYDLMHVENHMVAYDDKHKFNVTDEDPMWREFRHGHIAHVSTVLPKRVREFAGNKKRFIAAQGAARASTAGATNDAFVPDGDTKSKMDLREMAELIKGMPEFQAEFAKYTAVSNILGTCMDKVREIADLCHVEQDLVMGQNSKGEPLPEPMRILSDILMSNKGSMEDHLRLVMLFVLIRDGTAENHLEKLLSLAGVEAVNKVLFATLSLLVGAQLIIPDSLGISSGAFGGTSSDIRLDHFPWFKQLPPFSSVSNKVQQFLPAKGKRKDRVDSSCFAVSRWTPYLMDILEGLIAGKLDRSKFDFLQAPRSMPSPTSSTSSRDNVQPKPAPIGLSARFKPGTSSSIDRRTPSDRATQPPSFGLGMGTGAGEGTAHEHCGPRLIVCIVGGITWSEARTIYQLTERCIETRLAESDRHTMGRVGSTPDSNILPGGGGAGWNWEVVIGGTHILTPTAFIGDLDAMYREAVKKFPTQRQSVGPTPRKSIGLFR